jgi:FAD synthetase
MTIVMVFGTFDIIHPGHLYILKEARRYGNKLIVVVARDKTVIELKGKSPLNNEKERLKKIHNLPMVDHAILGSKKNKFSLIKKIKPDVICLGYDQHSFTEELDKVLKKINLHVKIVRLKAYKEHQYKSSIIRESMQNHSAL